MPAASTHSLGAFLKDRRGKLDPQAFGFSLARRRTPGLRREEVAQRANVSTTWYTWLEQGRGGAPSASVLERIAQALILTDAEREHLFLLALGHPPKARYEVVDSVTPRLQRVLDALEYSPAIVRTAAWDVLAWNRAAAMVLTDYANLEPEQRNILRLLFCSPGVRDRQADWQGIAHFVVSTFRADVIRAGASREVEALVEELCRRSPDFAAMWRDPDVDAHGGGTKRLQHPVAGTLELEYSSFAVAGRPGLNLMIYNPATTEVAQRLQALVATHASRAMSG